MVSKTTITFGKKLCIENDAKGCNFAMSLYPTVILSKDVFMLFSNCLR